MEWNGGKEARRGRGRRKGERGGVDGRKRGKRRKWVRKGMEWNREKETSGKGKRRKM